jgi:uncharacterized protein (TIGR03437 family)
VVVTLTVIPAQPLTWSTSGTPIYFGWVKGTSVSTTAQDATITYTGTAASMPFTVNPATVPLWLTVSAGSGQAVGGATATFTLAAGVVPALAAGNYTANVFFTATGAQSSLSIAVTLTVANTAATASIKEITAALGNTGCLTIGNCTIPNIFTMTANPVAPVPTVTVLSSDEPISFAATCTATTTYLTFVPTASPCQLSGASTTAASVSGVAYTWGTQMKANLASGLFAFGTPYGAVVTVTVTVSTTSLTSPQTLTLFYTYKIQPSDPTFTAISPTSAASATTTDLVVTLTGTNFVGPGNIINNGISPTKVFAGSVDVTANSVVMPGGNAIVVSLSPPFPAIVSPAKTSTLTISLGNQTGASAPAAPGKFSQTLTFTTSPVVYSVTSTASYVQPVAPQKPAVAPFELVSIFGANFTSGSSASGTTDAFGRFGTAVAIGGTVSAPVNLSVVFKSGSTSYSAPILYANATQINAIVPSGLPAGTATVWVTSGTATSDGSFAVTVNAADPGIFTLSSEGVGQGAILNSDYSVNSLTNATTAGSFVQLYVTGLGIPTSSGVDAASNTAAYPGGCVGVSGAAPANPTYVGYLQAANSTGITGWTKPTSPWTNLDGVVINSKVLLDVPGSGLPGLAPCFTTGSTPTTPVTVTFTTPTGTTVTQSGNTEVSWAGFASGSVAGLYQINVTVPAGLVATPGTAQNVPVSIAIGAATSPAGVTLAVK